MRFANRIVIVTGGASGIGRATCLRFAQEGARVLVADLNGDSADETAALIRHDGGIAESIRANVSSEEDAQRVAEQALNAWGRIDVLVNNAASFVKKRVEDATRQDWEEILGVNVMGTSFCSRFAIPAMKRQGGGAIVNLGSIYGAVAAPDFMTYNATKAAIINMTKCMALDLAPFNIRVNCVCPGQTHTPALEAVLAGVGLTIQQGEQQLLDRHMIKRFGRPEEIAPAILFLASDEASFITAATLMVDGGSTG
jgi:NAD(P)-dependent dehydrogenase (short-subunit alcohol dehydrogenase family)